MSEKVLGKISHYYGKIGVAVVKVKDKLQVGEVVKIKRKGGEEFDQTIASMQIEHEPVEVAKKGDDVGMKIDQAAKPGDILVKI